MSGAFSWPTGTDVGWIVDDDVADIGDVKVTTEHPDHIIVWKCGDGCISSEQPEELHLFMCPQCEEVYEDEDDAAPCCGGIDDED